MMCPSSYPAGKRPPTCHGRDYSGRGTVVGNNELCTGEWNAWCSKSGADPELAQASEKPFCDKGVAGPANWQACLGGRRAPGIQRATRSFLSPAGRSRAQPGPWALSAGFSAESTTRSQGVFLGGLRNGTEVIGSWDIKGLARDDGHREPRSGQSATASGQFRAAARRHRRSGRVAMNLGFFRKSASGPVCPGESVCRMRLRGWQLRRQKSYGAAVQTLISVVLQACERL
ncbi:hypothetical protein IWX90DRAFT_219241 [Phyllosticta citrichinensis]|uniref:Uncharacterized protein n=1 Tax=Phyllosticta citrichinensis TaxID=1130410 RepID=A0ABR1XU58_9PEZI